MYLLNIVLLGIILSIIYYELTDCSPGGIVVPGLLVMYISQPARLGYTLIVALLAYLICKFLSKYLLIFGKRRFVFLILVSIIVNLILMGIFSLFKSTFISFSIIGYTISGLIANDFYKQGIKKTVPGLVIVTGLLELIVIITTRVL